ncbi:thioredoxin family protein [Lysobacter sp. CCNWLW3]|uniref:DUF899 domain-containing protein n=1 Tax=unclassified Lysobacter TaxID=2635362 RepID=UPI002FD31E6D
MNAALAETHLVDHPVVTREHWLAARKTLLAHEKELTRLQDRIARERRALPWVRVEKEYLFDTAEGPRRLVDLFEGRRQLLVQHFMFAPGWEQGCKSCSYMADHNDGANLHLAQRDVTLLVVSRAPLSDIQRFRERMGWRFKWVSSYATDFNRDFGVNFTADEVANGQADYNYTIQRFPHEEAPGISVFYRDDAGQVFHTYSRYGRGVEIMMHTYALLELTPKGRDEDGLDYPMAWVRHHDRYASEAPAKAPAAAACCASQS